ncbi:MAG: hydrogenase maturation protease [Oscillochloris sp.]|nr:hydrogenase maturation protease [Oscillochloris sp.]
MDTLIIGCGNLLRGDDGVGPILIRRLWEHGLPEGVRVADGGTAGMDVAFKMRGADRVIIVDAARSGEPAGVLYKVPGEELEELPPLDGLHQHAFRWDHALAFGRWLLKDAYPTDITVYLIEGANFEFGAELTPEVAQTMDKLAVYLIELLTPKSDTVAVGEKH